MVSLISAAQKAPRKFAAAARSGFTLAEVLVTLAIIAIMAAVLLPALNQQISKGEAGRLSSDLTNIQTAIQAFVSDVHRYPGSISQLTTAVGSTDYTGVANTIPSALQAKWKGPYISRDVIGNTGSGGTISPAFTTTTSSTISFLTVTVSNISSADFANIENTLDEGTSLSSTTGVVRYTAGSSTLNYLALPIQ